MSKKIFIPIVIVIALGLSLALVKIVVAQEIGDIQNMNIEDVPDVQGGCSSQAWQCDGPGGKITYTDCGVDICQACPPESLGYRTECVKQTGKTKVSSPNVKAKAVPSKPKKKTSSNPVAKSSQTVPKEPTGINYINNIIDPAWWGQLPTYFMENIFNPIVNSDFINHIFHNCWWGGMRCCTAPVFPGNTHQCSDCSKVFEPTSITGPDPYKGVCNVDNVNGDKCRIIDCKK